MDHTEQLVADWLWLDPHGSTPEFEQLRKDPARLKAAMSPRIAFGTAGLRSEMGPGFAHMNDVTVLQASQGLVAYILENGGLSIVVGHDHRFHSRRFAELTASVALTKGLHAYFLGNTEHVSEESGGQPSEEVRVHTPLVPFAVDHYQASAGVMVTASHNPAKDNGYKVYYSNGCQIIPPHDSEIAAKIDANLEPWHGVWDVKANFASGLESGTLQAAKAEVSAAYLAEVSKKLIKNKTISYLFVYTPMHGVGGEMFQKICAEFGTDYIEVKEQAHPDPAFPTVKFPNPEEAGALDLAMKKAEAHGVHMVLASDPDADRFSTAVRTSQGWRQLTGNEIGTLFAEYVLSELSQHVDMKQVCLLNSTVSSQILRPIAESRGALFHDTLTGFKWIGNKALDMEAQGFVVPFAYEEAIGYMFGPVHDKDGIAAAVVWMQLYEKWFSLGGSDPFQKLDEIYRKHGYYKLCNGYYTVGDMLLTSKIFEAVRGLYDQQPRGLGDFTVETWRDLTVGYDSETADHVPLLPTDALSQMITGELSLAGQRVRFTCRGSGTEPKLKVYIEAQGDTEAASEQLARKCWATLRAEWFKPETYGLSEVCA